MQPAEPRRLDITGLRGLSVALVVAYHLQLRGAAGGFIGVDVFFVISGYLMTRIVWSSAVEGRFSYGRFLLARAARIWPALAALALALCGVGALLLPSFDLRTLSEQAVHALLFVSNHHFLDRWGYVTQGRDDLWLLHTWSLSVEWQFYLLYPLLLMAALVCGRRCGVAAPSPGGRGLLLALLGGLAALSFAWQVWRVQGNSDASFFELWGRAWELLAGGLAYALLPRAQALSPAARRAISHAGLLLVVGSALVIAWLRLRPVGLAGGVGGVVLGTALLLWAGHAGNAVLGMRWLQALGRWSYSIYLWHWPLIVASRLSMCPIDHPLVTAVLTAALSVLLGALSYRWVELPALRPGPSAWRAARLPLVWMVGAASCVAIVGLTDGLAQRRGDTGVAFRAYQDSLPALDIPASCTNFKTPASRMAVCPLRKDDVRKLLVIGDSHAEQLWPWFVRWSEVSVDFFAAAECPPVPGFERLQPGYHCLDYADQAWSRAMQPEYDTLVLSARWATAGARNGPPYCVRRAGSRCDVVAPAQKQALIVAALRTAIDAALAAGKTVVVLDNAPEARRRVAARLAREQYWYGQPRMAIDAPSIAAEHAWIDALWHELAGRRGFHRVSLRDVLCDASRCRVYDHTLARPIYTDESHFDPVWIAENADLFAPFVRRAGPAMPRQP